MKRRSSGIAVLLAVVCAVSFPSPAAAASSGRSGELATVAVNAVAVAWCANTTPPCLMLPQFLVKVSLRMRGNGTSQRIVTSADGSPEAEVSVPSGDYRFKIKKVFPGPDGLSITCEPPAPITAPVGQTTYVTVQCVFSPTTT